MYYNAIFLLKTLLNSALYKIIEESCCRNQLLVSSLSFLHILWMIVLVFSNSISKCIILYTF
jgi:hypothetical protein